MTSPIEPASDDLQFETAEPAAGVDAAAATTPAVQQCARCHRPLTGEYFAVGRHAICPDCSVQLQPPPTGTKFTRFAKAFGLGLGAGLIGAIIWYAVRKISGYEIGLIAVLVGFLVGKAVRLGSGNLGGRGYQVMAVLLTYCCIASAYVPDIVEALIKDAHQKSDSAAVTPAGATATKLADAAKDSPAAQKSAAAAAAPATTAKPRASVLKLVGAIVLLTAIVFGIAMAAPFLMGVQNILGLVIIGFALWEAWKFNRRVALPITGPYRVNQMPPAPGQASGGQIAGGAA